MSCGYGPRSGAWSAGGRMRAGQCDAAAGDTAAGQTSAAGRGPGAGLRGRLGARGAGRAHPDWHPPLLVATGEGGRGTSDHAACKRREPRPPPLPNAPAVSAQRRHSALQAHTPHTGTETDTDTDADADTHTHTATHIRMPQPLMRYHTTADPPPPPPFSYPLFDPFCTPRTGRDSPPRPAGRRLHRALRRPARESARNRESYGRRAGRGGGLGGVGREGGGGGSRQIEARVGLVLVLDRVLLLASPPPPPRRSTE